MAPICVLLILDQWHWQAGSVHRSHGGSLRKLKAKPAPTTHMKFASGTNAATIKLPARASV